MRAARGPFVHSFVGSSRAPPRSLLHLWSAQHNLTRARARYHDHSEERLALAVERFGRSRPDRLEFVRCFLNDPSANSTAMNSPDGLRTVRKTVSDDTVEPFSESSRPRAFSFWKLSTRCRSCRLGAMGGRWRCENESAAHAGKLLTFALLWLDRSAANQRGASLSPVYALILRTKLSSGGASTAGDKSQTFVRLRIRSFA